MLFRPHLAAGALLAGALPLSAALSVATNFESASARVLALNPQTQEIRITPAGDLARGMPNWWFLRADHVQLDAPLILEVVARDVTIPLKGDSEGKGAPLNPGWTLPARAAVSTNGVDWFQTDPGERSGGKCVYRIQTGSPSVWIAWGPPLGPTEVQAFAQRTARAHSNVRTFTLATTREGRPVTALEISEGARPLSQRPAVFITARQHAWEVGGSWVAIGMIEWLLTGDDDARWLRQNADIFFVPLMDADHVATGDGGKHAQPQDHNRDWSDTPHWPEVAAAQKKILELVRERRLAVFLDLHNPSSGATLQTLYVEYPPYVSAPVAALQDRFLALARAQFGEIKINDEKPKPGDLPVWKCISAPWVSEHGNTNTISFSVETPWNTPKGTAAGYREVGRKLALVTEQYLRERH